MKLNNNKRKNRGYAILFTVVVVGIISMITIGLSNAAYKQMVLSSVAKDSMIAFYQADIASEFALYADSGDFLQKAGEVSLPVPYDGSSLDFGTGALSVSPSGDNVTTYNLVLTQDEQNAKSKCFRATIEKTESTTSIKTKVTALGYNICNKSNLRTVERSIEVNY